MRTFATLSVCLLFAACKHEAAAPPAPAAQPPQPGFVTDPTGIPGTKDLQGLAALPPMLSNETSHRAAVKVPVEKVFDSLAQSGIELTTKHQVLARTAAASYCMLGVTKDTVAIAVCEYPSHDAAVAGEKLLDSRYAKLVPDAKRAINGATLVTVANADTHRDVRDRIFTTFKAL
ncbi:MAG TPA: hypothetical protein VH143_27355 [Kofleriaceae bacterium]|jgi:hypothetical protein|nr:hypothetical protein [Kofleriaceae bacterium]